MVLRGTRKNSVVTNVCLSVDAYPRKMDFDAADVFGGVVASDLPQLKSNPNSCLIFTNDFQQVAIILLI